MASIRTAIELQDNFTGILMNVINAVNMSVSTMEQMQSVMDGPIDTAAIQGVRDQLDQATIAAQELDAAMRGMAAPDLPSAPAPATPAQAPIDWQSGSTDVFTGSGIERFRQEVQSMDTMLGQLSATQEAIAKQAYDTVIFPPEAFQDLNHMATRIDWVRDRIQQIEANPLNIGTGAANAELEMLRGQLGQAVQEQQDLNSALLEMDVGAANEAYLRLSQTVGNTERYIRDNVDAQGQFNQEIEQGTDHADRLMQTIKRAVAAYATVQTASKVLDLSDQLTSTTARLDMMNDGLQTTRELQDMIFLSAERSRGSYQATADAVSKMGLMAGNAFGDSQEIIAFMEQVNKQFVIAGTEASGIQAAMLQLTQAMGSGVLRGEEYNSILEQAPNIIQNIAGYIEGNQDVLESVADAMDMKVEDLAGNVQGHLKDIAGEGLLSAGLLKAAMFYAADETNAKFESMPKTFGQIWTSFENHALMAFQPVLQRMNEIGNSEAFQGLVNGAIEGLSVLAGIAMETFDLLIGGAQLIADNWSWLSPIILGVAAALAVYGGYLAITKAMELGSAAAAGVMAGIQFIKVAAMAASTGATIAATAAQMGLNGAMYACPIVWIIMLIIALVAIIYSACAAIAKFTGAAGSGFGVIAGAVNVAIQFFFNLLSAAGTILMSIGAAAAALGHNIIAAFHNAIANVQTIFYDLLSTAMSVISQIASALSALPFVEFDASGLAAAADDYAAKAAAASADKMEYQDIGAAFTGGMSKMTAFSEGWASDAFSAGASWGDGVADRVSGAIGDLFDGGSGIPDPGSYADLSDYGTGTGLDGIGGGVDDIAGNTGAMADAMEITGEELKYLRDIAEQEAINRFTTAEIKIEQTNHNNIKNGMDLDGIVSGLDDALGEAIEIMTEGVHV